LFHNSITASIKPLDDSKQRPLAGCFANGIVSLKERNGYVNEVAPPEELFPHGLSGEFAIGISGEYVSFDRTQVRWETPSANIIKTVVAIEQQ
jgi:hypothetical protein